MEIVNTIRENASKTLLVDISGSKVKVIVIASIYLKNMCLLHKLICLMNWNALCTVNAYNFDA